MSRPPILVIGFNRAGTTSLHRLFKRSGIRSAHWTHPDGRNLAITMVNNIALGLRPLARMEDVSAFSDMSHVGANIAIEGARFFRALHAAYPQAYFILNTRPLEDWIASRLAHSGGRFLERYAAATAMKPERVLSHWRAYHQRHQDEVMEHFAANPRFLRFDITRDDPALIRDLVAPDYEIDTAHWGVSNQGSGAEPPSLQTSEAARA